MTTTTTTKRVADFQKIFWLRFDVCAGINLLSDLREGMLASEAGYQASKRIARRLADLDDRLAKEGHEVSLGGSR